jgi:nitroreductase
MDKTCMIEITSRRACRHFSDDIVDAEKLYSVLEAGRLAPSGFGLEPWRFLVMEKGTTHSHVARACFGQSAVVTAPVLIVLVARAAALQPDDNYVREQLLAEAEGSDLGPIMAAYRAFYDADAIASWAVGQCQIAAAFMMLEAEHQQLATCPIGGFEEQSLVKAVNLPDGDRPALVLALGRCVDKPGARVRRPFEDIVSYR